MTESIRRLPQTVQIAGLSLSATYAENHQGNFPQSFSASEQDIGWPIADVETRSRARPQSDPEDDHGI